MLEGGADILSAMAAKKSSRAKKPGAKKAATKKPSHGARLVEHLTKTGAKFSGKRLDPESARVKPLLSIAAKHPTVRAMFDTLIARNVWFGVGDLQTYAELILRGKSKEPWNAGASVVRDDDLVVARNGAGDIYVWNAGDGTVRFLVHDQGWAQRRLHDSFDDFLEEALWSTLETLDADALDDTDDDERASIAVAVKIAGKAPLDDEVREKLEDLGVI